MQNNKEYKLFLRITHNLDFMTMLIFHPQLMERALFILDQSIRLIKLQKLALSHHHNSKDKINSQLPILNLPIRINDSLQSMSHSNHGTVLKAVMDSIQNCLFSLGINV